MLGYRERVKGSGRVERWFAGGVLSVSEVKAVFGVVSHGGIGYLYSFLLSKIN